MLIFPTLSCQNAGRSTVISLAERDYSIASYFPHSPLVTQAMKRYASLSTLSIERHG